MTRAAQSISERLAPQDDGLRREAGEGGGVRVCTGMHAHKYMHTHQNMHISTYRHTYIAHKHIQTYIGGCYNQSLLRIFTQVACTHNNTNKHTHTHARARAHTHTHTLTYKHT